MMTRFTQTFAAAIVMFATSAWGQHHQHTGQATPYAGFQDRQIKGLSDEDIEELRRGAGWGLALPAELNGLPVCN